MEWLLIVGILAAFVVATIWDSMRKNAYRDRLANDPTITTVEKYLPELHRPPLG
jgi:hypothetical protein